MLDPLDFFSFQLAYVGINNINRLTTLNMKEHRKLFLWSRETEYNGKFYLPYLDEELKCLSLISAKIPEISGKGILSNSASIKILPQASISVSQVN